MISIEVQLQTSLPKKLHLSYCSFCYSEIAVVHPVINPATEDTIKNIVVCFLGAMAKRRAEIEEEQEQEEERVRNARLSVTNEGESVSKGRVDSVEGDADGDVEMAEESHGEVREKRRKRSESKDPENGVVEERGVREEREGERIENMEEEEGEID